MDRNSIAVGADDNKSNVATTMSALECLRTNTIRLAVVVTLGAVASACYKIPTVSPVYTRACAGTLIGSQSAPLSDPAIVEASGIVASHSQTGIYWVHNDSGDTARIFAIDTTGKTRATYNLTGISATDFEDIAIGPGPVANVRYLYIGDIGDNARARSHVSVLRVPEPIVPASPATIELGGIDVLNFNYPNGARNAESLLVHPRTAEITIIMKRVSSEPISIYRASGIPEAGSTSALTDVGTLNLPGSISNPTGVDISRDGLAIALRTYFNVFVYKVATNQTVESALAAVPCVANAASENQGEAIAFHQDGLGFVTLSEGSRQRLNNGDV